MPISPCLPAVPPRRARPLLGFVAVLIGVTGALHAQEGHPPEPDYEPVLSTALAKEHPDSLAEMRAIERRVRRVAQKVIPYTVAVRVGGSFGSGIIISEDGFVLTAGHVTARPNVDAVVILHDGTQVKARTLGINHGIDSGLVKITEKGPWPHAEMADAEPAQPGQWVVAVGHPNGYIKDRPPVVRLGRVQFVNQNVICTDCSLVGGDSGGPLFDTDGRVVGIHSRIAWQTTRNFHVPIATYRETWDRLVKGDLWGGSRRSSEPGKPLVGMAGNRTGEQCIINQVFPGSPAQKAGLRVGDVIRKCEGKIIHNFIELAGFVGKKKPGEKLRLEVQRGDEELIMEFSLGTRRQPLPGGPG